MASKSGAAWDLPAVAAAMSAAAIDPTRWVKAMDVVAEQTGSVGAVLVPVTGVIPNNVFSESIAGLSEAYFREGWHETDLRLRGLSVMLDQGVFDERHYTTEEEIGKHPYFQDLLSRFGLRWSAMIKMTAGDDLWTVAVQRSIEQGPFSPEELGRLRLLSAHLATAGAAAKALGFARVDAALAAFEASGTPVMLLDREARVFRLNAAAESLLGPDLRLAKRRLRPRDRNAARVLDAALHALLMNLREEIPLGAPVVIAREGRAPLLAYPSRIPNLTIDALAPCEAMIAFSDPEDRLMPSVATLRECFALTDAEARLAVQVASGLTLEDVARRSSISKITARNQLAAAMKKIGVRRQAELVATVSAMAPLRRTNGNDTV
jgi:DNA-binding CsgD family transcriptional regulator/PAS domain-containing protein